MAGSALFIYWKARQGCWRGSKYAAVKAASEGGATPESHPSDTAVGLVPIREADI